MTQVEANKKAIVKGHDHLNGMCPDQRTALVIAVYLATKTPSDDFAENVPDIIKALNSGLVDSFRRSSDIEQAIGTFIAAHPNASYKEICKHFVNLLR